MVIFSMFIRVAPCPIDIIVTMWNCEYTYIYAYTDKSPIGILSTVNKQLSEYMDADARLIEFQ